jgi:DNA-binding response OmpR family regulator
MADKPHILVVEDDEMVQDIVNHCLSSEGYRVTGVGEGVAMRKVMESDPAELVIMDIRLPGEDGFALTQYLHENYDVGVIIVSARTDHVDRVVGLEIGADDYVTKPFNERELLARVRSVMRRLQKGNEATKAVSTTPLDSGIVSFAEWRLDCGARHLSNNAGEPVSLTSSEFSLLRCFVSNPQRVMTRDRLMEFVYQRDYEPYDRSIDVLITRLRRKLEVEPKLPTLIKTVRGSGYLFAAEVLAQD